METKDPAKFAEYKKIRNIVTSQVASLRAQEQYEISEACKENPKKFWNYINSKRKANSDIGELMYVDDAGNNSVASTDELKVEVLCKSFSNVYTTEKDIDLADVPVPPKDTTDMSSIKLDTNVILSKLANLTVNKSAGPDDIYPRIFYEAKQQLVYPLHLLFETSLKAKQLPVDWCSANVVPI